ncbi:ATP-binding protein [Mangrovimonas sp. YM274]|uniref:ATP-binding protein n=1 Tax=Mangrovimonas sp. YM274 TaxID=3070660 RepID=UPI0027DDDE1D|nr:ATP-binding protein [Mangrovimonas sp. YM274]WMI70093.1 ATP-binding protein [Mangrovimonas sp. YM274]
MNTKRIVITGGPGTGKSSIIEDLKQRGYNCFDEISRQVTLEARKKGIEQLFLTEPLKFSEMLLEGRVKQFLDAKHQEEKAVFYDRGIPDVLAYMDYIGDQYPVSFVDMCERHTYNHVFVLAPWQEIFQSDSERYENFEQAVNIHKHLVATYASYGYHLHDVPFGSVSNRTDFILGLLNL